MFTGLEAIDWEELDAPEVPGLFRVIEADSDDAEDAALDLYHSLCEHFYQTAAASALPFLAEAVADPRLSTRADLSDTLRELANWPEWTGRWVRSWSAVVAILLPLLDDDDDEVRGNVLDALAAAPDEDGEVSGELRRRWEPAGDDAAALPRIDLAMAIVKLDEAGPDDVVRQWLTNLLDDPDAERRLGAAAAVLAAEPGDVRAREEMAEAVRRGDVFPWERKGWQDDPGPSAAEWSGGRTNAKAERVRDALGRLEAKDDEERSRGVQDAAFLLATWPSTEEELLPALARHLDDRSTEARAYAMHALAACGTRSASFADQIAEHIRDTTAAGPYTDATIGDLAVWALTRAGDRRCVPELLSWLDGSGRTGFDEFSNAGGHPQFYMLDTPALHEVLETAGPFAAELLPAVRRRLRSSSDYGWCREMAQILEAWGEDAAAAVPELAGLLPTDAGKWASRALAAMGPAAAEAAPALRRTFERKRGRLSRLTGPFRRGHLFLPSESSRPRLDRDAGVLAAWAYWHVTGDAEPPGPVLARALDDGGEYTALQCLGDIGAHPAGCADRAREFIRAEDAHLRLHAARAYARMTGEPGEAVRVFTEILRPIADAEIVAPLKWVVRYIGETGPPAAQTVPLMRAALALDLRLNSFGGWRAIDFDQRDRRSLADAIEAVSA